MLRTLPGRPAPLTLTLRLPYHLPSLLESKHEEEHLRLNSALFPLYLSRLARSPFSQRLLSVLAVDCYRTHQSPATFQQLVDYAHQHLAQFTGRPALVNLITQMAHYHCKHPASVLPLAHRALSLPEPHGAGESWHSLKMLIAVQQTVGVGELGEEWLRRVDFSKMRPLSLAMSLELLHAGGLGGSRLAGELVEMFVACEWLIPLADVHHLSYAIRKVPDPRFRECYFRVRSRIQSTIAAAPAAAPAPGSYASDQQLLELMRERLLGKYRAGPRATY